MSALRVARAATGRHHVLKFAGGYHGHLDGLLVQAGSGLATQALPASAGVDEATLNLGALAVGFDTLTANYLGDATYSPSSGTFVEEVDSWSLSSVGSYSPSGASLDYQLELREVTLDLRHQAWASPSSIWIDSAALGQRATASSTFARPPLK